MERKVVPGNTTIDVEQGGGRWSSSMSVMSKCLLPPDVQVATTGPLKGEAMLVQAFVFVFVTASEKLS